MDKGDSIRTVLVQSVAQSSFNAKIERQIVQKKKKKYKKVEQEGGEEEEKGTRVPGQVPKYN